MRRRALDGVMFRVVALDQDVAGQISASGAAGDLGEQLEDAFGGAEIRQAESMVGAHNPDEGNAVDIVALGDHLRAHQQVDFPAVQPGEQVLHVEPVADGIAIHASDAGVRKQFLQTLFALLRTSAQVKQVLALALRAVAWARSSRIRNSDT